MVELRVGTRVNHDLRRVYREAEESYLPVFNVFL